MVELGNIVTLENGMNFLILADTTLDNKRYVFAARTVEDDQVTDEYVILEVIKKDDDCFIQAVDDYDLYGKLHDIFSNDISKLMNGEEE